MFSGPGASKPTSVVPRSGDEDGPATDEGELEEEQGHVSDDDPIFEEDHLGASSSGQHVPTVAWKNRP